MRSCWEKVASERPTFKELTETFEQMLEDGLEYLDLNPGIVHNRKYCASPKDMLGKNVPYPSEMFNQLILNKCIARNGPLCSNYTVPAL